jgi:hypothetical protein
VTVFLPNGYLLVLNLSLWRLCGPNTLGFR